MFCCYFQSMQLLQFSGLLEQQAQCLCCDTMKLQAAALCGTTSSIHGVALQWFESYLTDRKLRVKCQVDDCGNYAYSDWHILMHGAPQGSCLGPLLFLIFCNDLRLNLTYMFCIQFTDDTTLYYSHRNLRVLRCCIENDLSVVMDWFRANSLTLNVQKTNLLLFSPKSGKQRNFKIHINQVTVKPVKETKFLGVILDNEMNWTTHVKSLLTKMKRNYILMCRGKNLLPSHNLKLLYYGHIYSHISYCIAIWGSMTNESLLAKIRVEQNKCVKLLNRTSPLDNLYKNYCILKLDEVIDLELKKFGYKVYRNLLPKNLLHEVRTDSKGSSLTKTHSYNTRNKNNLNLPMSSRKTYYNSFLVQSLKKFSTLPMEIRDCSNIEQFTHKVKKSYLT